MAENRRRTFVAAINRVRNFTLSREFLETDTATLNEQWLTLRDAHHDFITEHLKLVEGVSSEEFEKQNKFYADIERRVNVTAVEIQKRISTIIEGDQTLTYHPLQTSENQSGHLPATENNNSSSDVRENEKKSSSNERPRQLNRNESEKGGRQTNRVKSIIHKPTRRNSSMSDLRHRLIARPSSYRISCNNCGRNHKMHSCEAFRNLSVPNRRKRVRELNLCDNCFLPLSNRSHECRAKACKRCDRGLMHNSLLCLQTLP